MIVSRLRDSITQTWFGPNWYWKPIFFNVFNTFPKQSKANRGISVRGKSRLCDTITQTWYYHVSVILCITQTWYFISGKFLTLKKVSVRCALFRTLLNNTFPEQCIISKIVFPLKNGSITSVWYYHVCVILKILWTAKYHADVIVSHRRDTLIF